MRKTLGTVLFLIATATIPLVAQQLPAKAEIISKMKLVNDYWISQNPVPGNNQWARAVYFTGNMDFYKIYPKESYLQYSNLWASNSGWGLNGGATTRNADNQTCGQAYIDMYNLDAVKVPAKIAAIKTSIDNMVNSTVSTDWSWIDALYMSMPVFARMGALTGDTIYFKRMHDLYVNTKVTRGLFNPTTGLWYRDANYKPPYKTSNGKDCYWSRGNGWVVGAHVRVLQQLPSENPYRAEYIETFRQMAAALKTRQRTDGFWNPSLEDPDEYTGPETSGTAFFTYGLAWGINNHILDSLTYAPVVIKAWNGMTNLAVKSTGFLGYVQGVGAAPAYAVATSTQDFGVGGFLLAGTEVLKMAQGSIPALVNFSIKAVKAVDKTHIQVAFTNKIDVTSALLVSNYAIDNGISIFSAAKGGNDSTAILTTSTLNFGSYQLQANNIKNSEGVQIEDGETRTFVYTGIASVTASGFESGSSNTADKTLDYDLSTRWSCDGNGAWILYDLGALKRVNSVDLAFYNGSSRYAFFSISLSVDGTTYTEVFNGSSSGKTAALENYDFEDQNARYVKITGFGNSVSTWNSITETRINFEDQTLSSVGTIASEEGFSMYPNPMTGNQLTVELPKATDNPAELFIN